MCDLKTRNGKWCNNRNAYWLQYEHGPENVLTCKAHFERAYALMLDHKAIHDSIIIKVR